MQNASFIPSIPSIFRLSIDIESSCDYDCNFCELDSEFSCFTCRITRNKNTVISSVFSNFLTQLKNYKVNEFMIMGADPLLNFKQTSSTIEEIRKNFQYANIFILSNSMILIENKEYLEFLKKYNIILQVQFISDSSIYLNEFNNLIDFLKQSEIKYSIVKRIPSNINLENMIFSNYSVKNTVKSNKFLIKKSNIKIPANLYYNTFNKVKNKCIYGKMHLNLNGDIQPCIKTDYIAGNIKTDKLNFITSNLSNFSSSKVNNRTCENCELEKHCESCFYIKNKFENYKYLCELNV